MLFSPSAGVWPSSLVCKLAVHLFFHLVFGGQGPSALILRWFCLDGDALPPSGGPVGLRVSWLFCVPCVPRGLSSPLERVRIKTAARICRRGGVMLLCAKFCRLLRCSPHQSSLGKAEGHSIPVLCRAPRWRASDQVDSPSSDFVQGEGSLPSPHLCLQQEA